MKTWLIGWGFGVLMVTGVLYAYEQVKTEEITMHFVQGRPDQYCAKMRDGKLVVMFQGNILAADVFLKNGTTVKPDGTIITKDGVRTNLKEGECIGADGKIIHIKVNEPYQEEE